jgi:hypothetical protein
MKENSTPPYIPGDRIPTAEELIEAIKKQGHEFPPDRTDPTTPREAESETSKPQS